MGKKTTSRNAPPVVDGGAVIIDDSPGRMELSGKGVRVENQALRVTTAVDDADGITDDGKTAFVEIEPNWVLITVGGQQITIPGALLIRFKAKGGWEHVKGTRDSKGVLLEVRTKFKKQQKQQEYVYICEKPGGTSRLEMDLTTGDLRIDGPYKLEIREN
jgi:hypothetical protein